MNGSLQKLGSLLGRASLALIALLVVATPLLAQDAAAPAPAAAEELSIMDYVKAAGFIGWVLIALSIVAFAVIIENIVSLRRDKLAPPELIDEVQSLFDEGRYQEAMELCENEPHFFGRVCSAGIAKIGHSYDVIETALQEMGDEETVKLHQKIGWLTVIGATAPMIGLLGTVSGMIAAFQKIATTANPSPSELAGGIYSALLTTLFGLMIAIPVIAAYAFVRNRLTVAVIEIGAIAEDLFERFRPQA